MSDRIAIYTDADDRGLERQFVPGHKPTPLGSFLVPTVELPLTCHDCRMIGIEARTVAGSPPEQPLPPCIAGSFVGFVRARAGCT